MQIYILINIIGEYVRYLTYNNTTKYSNEYIINYDIASTFKLRQKQNIHAQTLEKIEIKNTDSQYNKEIHIYAN